MTEPEIKELYIETCPHDEYSSKNFHMFYEPIAKFMDWDKKIPPLGDEFKCRFCGTSDRSLFKLYNAHTFPKATGNKWLFSKYECKNCNKFFSVYESELANHGLLMASLYGINGKKYKKDGISLKRTNDKIGIQINKDLLKGSPQQSLVLSLDFQKNEEKAELTVSEFPYIPLYLYKTLAKIAYSIMPDKEINGDNFEQFLKMLMNREVSYTDENYKYFFYIYHNRIKMIKRDPFLVLFKKKSEYMQHQSPTYSFIFAYANHMFQIYLPYFSGDEWLRSKDKAHVYVLPEMLVKSKENKLKFTWINGANPEKMSQEDFSFGVKSKIHPF